ncbi:MAG: hypothetical protein GY805_11270 [Chloroflexi bacterium]|nr:hypothetical protein [Chloroflexota bacterium]
MVKLLSRLADGWIWLHEACHWVVAKMLDLNPRIVPGRTEHDDCTLPQKAAVTLSPAFVGAVLLLIFVRLFYATSSLTGDLFALWGIGIALFWLAGCWYDIAQLVYILRRV